MTDSIMRYSNGALEESKKNMLIRKKRELKRMESESALEIANIIAQGMKQELKIRAEHELKYLDQNLEIERTAKIISNKKRLIANARAESEELLSVIKSGKDKLGISMTEDAFQRLEAQLLDKIINLNS